MNHPHPPPGRRGPRLASAAAALALIALLAGCAARLPAPVSGPTSPALPAIVDEPGITPVLDYYLSLQRMTPQQIVRERTLLAAQPPTPGGQLRTAMVLGHPRAQQDLPKALGLLDGVLKSNDPAAVALQPLARMLADGYGERLRLETQYERQGQQLKENQRKAVELQEKIDSLADIERTLPQRPRATRSGGGATR